MRVVMVGAGYVGLVSGACFADFGHHVTCLDKDGAKIDGLKRGELSIFEPGLTDLVNANLRAGRLNFATEPKDAVGDADVVFIAVGTPSRRGDGHADLSHVRAVVREIAPLLSGFTVVVTKSTVPVGTGDEINRMLRELRPDADIAIAANPEFLREGAAIHDFKHPDRIVIGTDDPRAQEVMIDLYRSLYLNAAPLVFTDRRTAELIKYAANAFLAVKITYINEMADLCESLNVNVQDVARGMGLDNRIGAKFLHAGPGYGGSCFPKDMAALIKTSQDSGVPLNLIETAARVNATRKESMVERVAAALGGDLANRTVAVLGLTFKPNTDDVRESPAIALVNALIQHGAKVRAFDPAGMLEAKKVLPGIIYCEDVLSCAEGAACLVIATEWEQFRALDLDRLKQTMAQPVIVDLLNIYPIKEMHRTGFDYYSVGRQPVRAAHQQNSAREPAPLRKEKASRT